FVRFVFSLVLLLFCRTLISFFSSYFGHLLDLHSFPTRRSSDLPWVAGALTDHLAAGRRVLVVAHGNSLRALCAVLDRLDAVQLAALNLPNARPLAYRLHPDAAGELWPEVRGGEYLDAAAAHAEAAVIAAEGGT